MKKYFIDSKLNIFSTDMVEKEFNYSDGDNTENNIYDCILNAADLTIGSPELLSRIIDWPTRYHLSNERVDLLRPITELLKGDILEIGSGCGAITRFLGELNQNVVALEGSERRAAITASRCRDLSNVKVYCDNFIDFESDKKFDVITLIGVLEYSRIYVNTFDPIQSVLVKACNLLKPDGKLIIAIENQLGLKYLAGSPEDHTNQPFLGVENKYVEKGPVTFGKKAIEREIYKSGFNITEFFYPFPDYKLPSVIITDNALSDNFVILSDVLKYRTDNYFSGTEVRSFNSEAALPVIIENGLIGDLANSFLIVAGKSSASFTDKDVIAYSFNSTRKREFCKANKIVKRHNGCFVEKEKLFPEINEQSDIVRQELLEERYIHGELLVNGLLEIVSKPDWSIEQVVEWAKIFAALLKTKSIKSNAQGVPMLEGKYFDFAPFNIIVNSNGELCEFDCEWVTENELRIDYIIFRTLYFSLSPIRNLVSPSDRKFIKLSDLCMEVTESFYPGVCDLKYYELLENGIVGEIYNFTKNDKVRFNHVLGISSSTQRHVTGQKLNDVQPLEKIKVQLFYANNDLVFFEEKSFFQNVSLNEMKDVDFEFGAEQGKFKYLRFDIGDEAGLLIINKICIKNKKGELLWTLNLDDLINKKNCLLIECPEHFPDSIIQLSTSNDPQFSIRISNKLEECLLSEIVVHIEISQPSEYDMELLTSGIIKPLSFLSKQEIDSQISSLETKNSELKMGIDNFSIENRTMISAVEKYKEQVKAMDNDNSELLTNIKDYQLQLDKLRMELNERLEIGIYERKQIDKFKDTIERLEDAYVKRNLLQIAYARIFRK